MGLRRLVHGHEHVDRAWQRADSDEQRTALEEFITECVWGTLWARNGLPSKIRSLLTIGLLIAANRPSDLRLHIRSAVLRNGCSMAEIREVMLHTAAYCGIAAAVDGFAMADEIASELATLGAGPFTPRRRRSTREDSGRGEGE
jgi:4-carboxymuconolactone decarboxylase